MKKSNRTFLTYIFLFNCIFSTTQLYSQSDTAISVDRILEKYIAALGGKDAILKLTSRVRKGIVEIPGINGLGTVERYQKAPNKLMSIQQFRAMAQLRQFSTARPDGISDPKFQHSSPKARGWQILITKPIFTGRSGSNKFFLPCYLKELKKLIVLKRMLLRRSLTKAAMKNCTLTAAAAF